MRNLLFVSILITVFSCQQNERYNGPIIDVHMHAFAFDHYGKPPPPNPITGQVSNLASKQEVIQKTLSEMERLHIEKAIISGPLENVLEWKELSPQKFMGGLYYHPRTPLPDFEKVIPHFEKGELQVLGELGLAYGGLSPLDSSLHEYFAYAERQNIPVGIHMALGEPNLALSWAPSFRVKYVDPLLIEELIIKYPKLKIYLMHAGWPFLENTKAILCMFENVYVDISVINWILPDEEFQQYLKGLMAMNGSIECDISKKIMFGSDQMVWIDAIELAIENVKKIEFLSSRQKADIFYNNAVRFFELDKM